MIATETAICLVQPWALAPSETFIQAHIERLPARVSVVHGGMPTIGDRLVLSQSLVARAARRAIRAIRREPWAAEATAGYRKALRRIAPRAVLAEYGEAGVAVMDACARARIPLVVHFHGYDASDEAVLTRLAGPYRCMFQQAAAIIAVSRAMRAKLIELGAPEDKVHYNPYGVDCDRFDGGEPATAPRVFVAVGRFVEKKAPYLTLLAFAEVHRACPQARLRMIGDGPLYGPCRDLAGALGIADAVSFLGVCSPDVVQAELRAARCFVQHSVQASNGDSEGTPVAVLEAQATGLPVVSTRHAGIPDVVEDGVTGLLVEERDVEGMAARMRQLAEQPELAQRLGAAGQLRVRQNFTLEQSISRLWRIINSCIYRQNELAAIEAVAASWPQEPVSTG